MNEVGMEGIQVDGTAQGGSQGLRSFVHSFTACARLPAAGVLVGN